MGNMINTREQLAKITQAVAMSIDHARLSEELEAKNAEVESLAKEALHAMPDNRLGTLWSYIATLEQERDEARAEASRIEGRAVEFAARADRAEAALERVKAGHRKGTVFSHEDSCTEASEEHRREHHVESSDIGEYYCDQLPEYVICIDCSENSDPDCGYPCPTIQSLAPEAGQRVTPSS